MRDASESAPHFRCAQYHFALCFACARGHKKPLVIRVPDGPTRGTQSVRGASVPGSAVILASLSGLSLKVFRCAPIITRRSYSVPHMNSSTGPAEAQSTGSGYPAPSGLNGPPASPMIREIPSGRKTASRNPGNHTQQSCFAGSRRHSQLLEPSGWQNRARRVRRGRGDQGTRRRDRPPNLES